MKIEGWKYYNHALIPTCAPHETPNLEVWKNLAIWSRNTWGGWPLLARWTTDWDCKYATSWWYLIKDTPFDINVLKSKRRYEINKGLKNFSVREIRFIENVEQIADVYEAATQDYAGKQSFNRELFLKNAKEQDSNVKYYGAFNEDGKLCAFLYLRFSSKYADYVSHKAIPEYERLGVNAALIAGMLYSNVDYLSKGGYISDGSRNINHNTAFQEYLEKYFGFRKCFSKLHVKYRRGFGIIVRLLYPFRKCIKDNRVQGIMRLEEISRSFKE